MRYHRLLIHVLGLCFVVAYIGLGVAPVGGAWVWMVLSGIGNGMFPLALTMIGLRSRSPQTTAALSAFVQAIGYVVAGTGPLLFGVLYGATGSWVLPLALLWISLALAWMFGWLACAPRYVDDEMAITSWPLLPRCSHFPSCFLTAPGSKRAGRGCRARRSRCRAPGTPP